MGSLRARSWLGWTLHCRVWGTLHLHTEVWGSSLRVEVPDPLLALRFSAPGGPPLFPGIWSLPSFTPVMAGHVLFMPHLCRFFFLLLQLSEPRGRGSLLSGAPTIHSSPPGWARVTSSPYTSFTHRLQCNVRAIPRFPGLRGQGPLWRLWLYLGQTVICLVWTEVILEPQGRARAAERRVLPNSDRASIYKDRCWREACSADLLMHTGEHTWHVPLCRAFCALEGCLPMTQRTGCRLPDSWRPWGARESLAGLPLVYREGAWQAPQWSPEQVIS